MVNIFTVILDMLYNLNLSDLLEGLQVTEGSDGSLPSFIFLNGHNIKPTSCRPCCWFRTPATKHSGSWSWACTGPTI